MESFLVNFKNNTQDIIKKTEKETLNTFKTEVPSIDFHHKDEKSFNEFSKITEKTYRECFKFPPKMFSNTELIDFGAGTGHNTISLANWGAKCTLVELSDKSLGIAKEVFELRAKNLENHRFVNSSIFDYEEKNKLYDIVHCRGVLSHTAGKEKAFKKISSYLKKGGYLIFGDPNKAGGFQNMLQRYALYKFSNNDEEIVKNSEILFKEDIDRSQAAVPRTRNEIIYDRWVIQSQDDPSLEEVTKWMSDCGLKLYSSYPAYPQFLLTDSHYNKNKVDFEKVKNIPVLSEILWMMKTEDDISESKTIEKDLSVLNNHFNKFASYVANCNKKTKIETKEFFELSDDILNSIDDVSFVNKLKDKFKNFILESKELVKIVNSKNISDVDEHIKKCSLLFKGPCGVRHVDFIANKEI